MKRWLVLTFALLLAACAVPVPTSEQTTAALAPPLITPASEDNPAPSIPEELTMNLAYPDLGPAPELAGDIWLNTKVPLRLASLRGKVVLVDMWTFG